MEQNNDGIRVRGFFHLTIENQDGQLIGDSGLVENTITNLGKQHYLAEMLGKIAGSSGVGYAALGTGGAPNATDTTQPGELGEGVRDAVTANQSGSTSVVFTGTFSSTDSFVTATRNISNIGLWATNTSGSIFAGAAFTSSSCGTNQNVNYTYTITFT
jgi:hypothetical protein